MRFGMKLTDIIGMYHLRIHSSKLSTYPEVALLLSIRLGYQLILLPQTRSSSLEQHQVT